MANRVWAYYRDPYDGGVYGPQWVMDYDAIKADGSPYLSVKTQAQIDAENRDAQAAIAADIAAHAAAGLDQASGGGGYNYGTITGILQPPQPFDATPGWTAENPWHPAPVTPVRTGSVALHGGWS